jgi:hypothetical protein
MVTKNAVESRRRRFHGVMADSTMTVEVNQSGKQIITMTVDHPSQVCYRETYCQQATPDFRDHPILNHETSKDASPLIGKYHTGIGKKPFFHLKEFLPRISYQFTENLKIP